MGNVLSYELQILGNTVKRCSTPRVWQQVPFWITLRKQRKVFIWLLKICKYMLLTLEQVPCMVKFATVLREICPKSQIWLPKVWCVGKTLKKKHHYFTSTQFSKSHSLNPQSALINSPEVTCLLHRFQSTKLFIT